MTDQTDDIQVLEAALAWLKSGRRVALATVIKTWGSSPRPPGSLLAMNHAGQFVGSVSGGCVEEALLAQYRDGELTGPTRVDFGIDRQQASRMGLPCGGRLELLVEELTDADSVASLLAGLHNGERITRSVNLASGEVRLQPATDHSEFTFTTSDIRKTFGPGWQLVLIGDGQLARHLASMALHLDYRIIICDPRDEFAPAAPLDHVHYTRAMPDDTVKSLRDTTRTAIVTLSHDPRQDDLGLSAALESSAFYIGALGSKKSAQSRRDRLATLGYSTQQIARIHGPAGVHIGSKRPAEIAVSILAQITAIRNGIAQPAQYNDA